MPIRSNGDNLRLRGCLRCLNAWMPGHPGIGSGISSVDAFTILQLNGDQKVSLI